MNRPLLATLLTLLSFVGMADAWYLAESAISDTALVCNLGSALDGCNIVASSPYSQVFGIPLALFGVGFYAFIFVLAALVFLFHVRALYRVIVVASVIGVLASVVFLFIQFALIKAVCVYCIASAVIALLIWLVSRELWRKHAPPKLSIVPDAAL